MSKIKFRIAVWDKNLLFQVLQMDKRFLKEKFFHASNGISVGSISSPEIVTNVSSTNVVKVFLWGSEIYASENIDIRKFSSESSAEEAKKRIIDALAEWAENWEGFKTEKMLSPTPSKDLYEF